MEGDGSPLFNCIVMIEKKTIETLINEWIGNPAVFLVELKTDRENNIRVFMDSDSGFSIEQCVELTRFIESNLDREIEDYQLTVSSYGITQPFVSSRQFRKYVGRDVDIEPLDGKPFSGTLLGFKAEQLSVRIKLTNKEKKEGKSDTVTFQRSQLRSVKPSISFNG